MLEAFSLAWGLLVPAEDCDHSSFKNLGLLCPVCKESVFLVTSSTRSPHSRKKKDGSAVEIAEQKVAAHFSHHPDTSKSQVAQCELKLSRMTSSQRQAIEAKGRNQRRSIFQKHFWKIVMTSHRYLEFESWKNEGKTQFINLGAVVYLQPVEQSAAVWDKMVGAMVAQFRYPEQVAHTKTDLERAILMWQELAKQEPLGEKFTEQLRPWVESLNVKMQVAVVSEAIDYLCGSRQIPMLTDLFHYSLSNYIHASALAYQGHKGSVQVTFNSLEIGVVPAGISANAKCLALATDQFYKLKDRDLEGIFYYVRDDIVQALAMVMWRDRFAEFASK